MTDAERIEQLKTTVPRPPWTRRQKIGRAVSIFCTAIALMFSMFAIRSAWNTASCVNGVLGDRAPATQSDARAHAEWAESLSALLAAPKNEQSAMVSAFVAETTKYAHTLAVNQRYRDAHPLGRC